MNDGEDSADLVMIGENQDGNTYCQLLSKLSKQLKYLSKQIIFS